MRTTETRNADTIRAEIAQLEGELAMLAGEPLILADGRERYRDAPQGGAVLYSDVNGRGTTSAEWYSTAEAARVALVALGRTHGRVPSEDGWYLDLQPEGDGYVNDARAWIERQDAEPG